MTMGQALAHRRAARDREESLRSTGALLGIGAGLRAQAQAQVLRGRPELAAPYLDEAELFESAARRSAGL